MNKLWFGCPKCHLAFYSKGEYEAHYAQNHPGDAVKRASMVESKG